MPSIFNEEEIKYLKSDDKLIGPDNLLQDKNLSLIEVINYNYLSKEEFHKKIDYLAKNSFHLQQDFELFLSLVQQFYLKFENSKEHIIEYSILRKLDDFLKKEMFFIFKNYRLSSLTINNNIIPNKDENLSQIQNKLSLCQKMKIKIKSLLIIKKQ